VAQKYKQYKNFKVLDRIKDFLLIVTSSIAVFAFIRTCVQDETLNNINYNLQSIQYQPRLKLIGIPEMKQINVDTLIVNVNEENPESVSLKFDLTIYSKVKITNLSDNALADFVLLVAVDTISNVKDYLMGKSVPDSIDYNIRSYDELDEKNILPKDTIESFKTIKISHITNNRYIFHIIYLYKNELGNYYHSHTLIPYTFVSKSLSVPFKNLPNITFEQYKDFLYNYFYDSLKNGKLMQPGKPVTFYETYNKTERELVKIHLKKLIPGIKL